MSSVTVANDNIQKYWTDFGDGYSDVGTLVNHTYQKNGSYEIKTFALLASGNKKLLVAKNIDVLN
jgi:PKD repeat protein